MRIFIIQSAVTQPAEKVAAFLRIMEEKANGYNKLIYILQETNQTRAAHLLEIIHRHM